MGWCPTTGAPPVGLGLATPPEAAWTARSVRLFFKKRVSRCAPLSLPSLGLLMEGRPYACHAQALEWNTRAGPSVPDQIVTQRPETHNAHIFSVIGDGRKILERWNTHFAQSSSGPAGPSSAPRCHEGVWRRSLDRGHSPPRGMILCLS